LNNGPTPAAIDAFEQVRKRAFGANPIGTTPSDYTGFFSALMKERSFELCGEGNRKYDLIRWNLLATKLAETKANLAAMAASQPPYDKYPTTMYYKTNSTSLVWLNSLYTPAPGTAPAGSASVAWVGSGITTTILSSFAIGFTPNKNELLPLATSVVDSNPNLSQNNGF
jgi:hypothetical protein